MTTNVIQWRLREVMEKYRIKSTELAKELDISTNSMANLRKTSMPRIDGDRLNSLVVGLNRLRQQGTALITPSDLIQFTVSPDELAQLEGR